MAVGDEELKIHYHQVIEASDAIAEIKQLEQKYALNIIVMGNLTTAQIWQEKLNRVQIEKWSFETAVHQTKRCLHSSHWSACTHRIWV